MYYCNYNLQLNRVYPITRNLVDVVFYKNNHNISNNMTIIDYIYGLKVKQKFKLFGCF